MRAGEVHRQQRPDECPATQDLMDPILRNSQFITLAWIVSSSKRQQPGTRPEDVHHR
jgi:hypothetical protein